MLADAKKKKGLPRFTGPDAPSLETPLSRAVGYAADLVYLSPRLRLSECFRNRISFCSKDPYDHHRTFVGTG